MVCWVVACKYLRLLSRAVVREYSTCRFYMTPLVIIPETVQAGPLDPLVITAVRSVPQDVTISELFHAGVRVGLGGVEGAAELYG